MGKFIKITLALIACSSISLFTWALAVGLALSKSGFGVAPDKPSTVSDSLGLIFLFLFHLFYFLS
jgi:cation transporter-like permease